MAVRLPVLTGLVMKVIVNVVAVAAVTVPIAPLLKITVLRDATRSNPKPVIVIVEAVINRLVERLVTTGVVSAT